MKAGFLPAVSLARGGPRALAAFVERPQAACSNRRYIYSLKTRKKTVNEKIHPVHPIDRRI
jgi:hypothetical protein